MCAMTNSAAVGTRAAGSARHIGGLREMKFFKGRDDARPASHGGADPLAPIAVRVTYLKNHTVYYEGDDAQYHFKVVSGMVRLCKVTEDGRRQIAAFPTAGDFFGWTGQDTYNYSAEAVTEVVLEKYHRRGLEESVKSNPKAGQRVLTLLSNQLTSAHDHLLVLGRMTAEERIAAFLLDRARRREDAGADRVATIELPMRRKDIAD